MSLRIEDYALIGDCQTAALVGRNGSIDWLCLPRFDSEACFAALLGTPAHGRWLLAPARDIRSSDRRYRPGTLVLETEFETADGAVTVVDCMPVRVDSPYLIRMVTGMRGQVLMRTEFVLRPAYGSVVPWVKHGPEGCDAIAGPDAFHLWTPASLHGRDFRTVSEFTVKAGELMPFVLAWHRSHEPAPPVTDAATAIRDCERWWRDWSERCTYRGPYEEAVIRSLITLKALTFEPTGGVVAAVTTSLPEQLGGVRNWDYRYCWLRDAVFTLHTLVVAGYQDEALAWREWLLRAVAGIGSQLQTLYGVAGERRQTEIELTWLPGYEHSRPVRIGNAAHEQFQLDVYGEVLVALYFARRNGFPESREEWQIAKELTEFLEQSADQPDQGIWEVRGPRQHFTYSKAMVWAGLDRMVQSVEQFGLQGPIDRWRLLRDRIHAEVCAKAFDPGLNAFVQAYGSKELDASVLLLPLFGFVPAADPRMLGTVAAIERRLLRDGLVERYSQSNSTDGLPPGEGVFLLCSFWLASIYALQGRHDDARQLYERLLDLRNDVGLLAEEYEPRARRFLGNYPQAFSHVGLVHTARNLVAGARGATPATAK
jgi:GH15 family glucan-1,4-alpha-glucosidase